MQIAIDSAKRTFDIDLNEEIDRIKKDINIEDNGYPIFWKHIKDKKVKINGKKFNINKINQDLVCPMNYLMNIKFKEFKNKESTLPLEYFFNKFELEDDRRKSKKVENLIQEYSLQLYESMKTDNEDYLLLRSDFDNLLNSIRTTYISKSYIGLMSWLLDRAFLITTTMKNNEKNIVRSTNENKSLLLKVLFEINPSNILKIFSKNM